MHPLKGATRRDDQLPGRGNSGAVAEHRSPPSATSPELAIEWRLTYQPSKLILQHDEALA